MKFDEGFKQSEKMLNELETKIHKEYAQASKEMADKATAYFNRFKSKDLEQRDRYESGEISKKEYTEWRKRQMATGKRYIAMRDTLAKDLTNTDKIAMKMVNQALPDVYALNMNYGTYSIEKDSKINTSFTLYNHAAVERLIKDNPKLLPNPKVDIPKDLRWNQQHIQSAITQGILQGKSIPEIAKNLQNVTGMDERAAIRNARTAMTGAQNAGRLDSMKRAQARGIGVKKGWLATLDHVTRDSHVDLDGEVQELDRAFSNGLMFPGDASGAPAEVYNCRCRLTHEYDKYKTDWSNPANRNTSKLGNMSYQEWKDKHKEKATKIRARQNIQNMNPLDRIMVTLSIEANGLKIFNLPTESQELIANAIDKCVEKCPQLVGHTTKIEYKADMGDALASSESLVGRINISEAFKDYEKLKENYEYNVKIGFNPEGTSVENVIIHELGHQIDGLMTKQGLYDATINQYGIIRTSQRVQKEVLEKLGYFEYAQQQRQYWYDKGYRKRDLAEMMEAEKREFIQDNLSRYASTNSNEFFAECFSEYMTSKNPRPAAKAFGEIFEKLLGELK